MPDTLIGTSGFSFSDWNGPVYPPGVTSEQRLPWYAQRLNMVELNFSFYRMPAAHMLESMASRVPQRFEFVVKAHRSLTHEIDADWQDRLARLREAVRPLSERDILAGTLLQFPYRFHYTSEHRRYLAELCERSKGMNPAVEFRNAEWIRPSVLEGLSKRATTFVVPDLPRLRNLPEFHPVATTNTLYARLHGRNSETWWGGTNNTRYHYRYDDQELSSIAHALRAEMHNVERLIVTFNNHFEGNAFDNAMRMSQMLPDVHSK
ncbi:MAG: DUF72 domain-containing protein [Spirochaetota bacterium]